VSANSANPNALFCLCYVRMYILQRHQTKSFSNGIVDVFLNIALPILHSPRIVLIDYVLKVNHRIRVRYKSPGLSFTYQ